VTDAALRDLAARAATGDGPARRALAGHARLEARDILAEQRFRAGKHGEGPLHGIFVRLGDWVESLIGVLPGGRVSGWALIVAVGVALTAAVATWVGGRRRRAAAARRVAGPGDVPGAAIVGPGELERQAADAERAGDLDAAIRLRFAAGLLRLDGADAIVLRPSLTSGDVGRTLRSPRYDGLARTHDAVAYGGRHAAGDDATEAREGWPEVVSGARHR
jgi:hypothetical protein